MKVPVPLRSNEPRIPDMKMRLWFVVIAEEVRTAFVERTWFAARDAARRYGYEGVPFVLLKGDVL